MVRRVFRVSAALRSVVAALVLTCVCAWPPARAALPEDTLERVVSVLPVWPGQPSDGEAPEGSGVAIGADGLIATAWHVVAPATSVEVRLSDGRIMPAQIIGHDVASDIALLKVETDLPSFAVAASVGLAEPVCAIGNAFGLGLSVTCGVVSARQVTNAGFHAVEDFIQTDAAVNPGASGGALVTADGRLAAMLSAIYAAPGGRNGVDGDIGVSFAVSAPLLLRVARDLQEKGRVDYVSAGWRLAPLERRMLSRIAGAMIAEVSGDGPAAASGFKKGDILLSIGARRVRKPRDAMAALALARVGDEVEATFLRDGRRQTKTLIFDAASLAPSAEPVSAPVTGAAPAPSAPSVPAADCPHPAAVCDARRLVFPVSSYYPLASAVRIGPDLLVTNRHVLGDRFDAQVMTPSGPLEARAISSAYPGDLILLQVNDLPPDWPIAEFAGEVVENAALYAIGADPRLRLTRVFAPGALLRGPADGAPLGRLHVSAAMRPGVSGGALVNAEGLLVGVAVGGGDGRFEAIPAAEIIRLLELREDGDAQDVQERLGGAFARCDAGVVTLREGGRGAEPGDGLTEVCLEADNLGQLLEAGRAYGLAGDVVGAVRLHEAAAAQAPNSTGARLSLLTSLQLAGRFEEMLPHARWALEAEPANPLALRFAIQSGVWGGDPDLAEAGYAKLEAVDARQAGAARRFIDAPPPAPPRR